MLKIRFIISVTLCITFLIITSTIKNKTRIIEKNISNINVKILFKTKDMTELKDIYESVAGEIDELTFYDVYNQAIGNGDGYPFLFVDLHKKSSQPSMFRKKFDEYIIPEEK